jgi:ABC-type antimicrobial peptide transport system permease subunit
VVGIAADAQHQGRLPVTGTFATPNDAYFPITQRPERSFALLVRTRGEPEIGPVREAVRQFDPDVPVFAVATMHELFALEEAPARFAAILMAVFGGSALLLAGLGVYGVISFTVSQRTREIGLRTALGADRSRTLLDVLSRGMRIAGVGVALGALLGFAARGRLVAFSTLIPEPDGLSLFASGGALLLIAVAACLVPALRATRVAPNVALRE